MLVQNWYIKQKLSVVMYIEKRVKLTSLQYIDMYLRSYSYDKEG